MKKLVCAVLCTLMVISVMITPAFAAMESNAYIESYSAQITLKGNGKIRVDFGTHGTGTMDVIGAETILLYENGSLVRTYSKDNLLYSSMLVGTNRWYFYGGVDYNGVAGRTYYAEVKHYAEDSTGSGYIWQQTPSEVAT